MLKVEGHATGFSTLLFTIGLLALIALFVVLGIHVFLAAVGRYAPWEQIWAG